VVAVLALHAVVAALAAPAARRLGRQVFWLCALAPAATLAWAAGRAPAVLDGRVVEERVRWVPALGLDLTLRLDGFSLLMLVLIAGVGVLVFGYSTRYFPDRPDLGRFAATLTAFAGSMLGLVLADNLLVLYAFWELTSITSYLLIGFEDEKAAARAAALQAILVTAAGGLAMLGGFVLLGQAAGTYSLSGILAEPPGGAATGAGLALVLLGAFTKSAQVPFHSWLPGAMAAPTPVSAYLHSATMVKAGVYLLARLAPAFAAGFGFWRPVVVGVGLATMLTGGLRALRAHDLKLLLAHGTVSQLGMMVALVGAGLPELTFAGAAVILAHGLFKASLFLVVGIVDHHAHTRDLRALSGMARALPLTFAAAAAAAASMVGLPPMLGFAAKEGALEALLHAPGLGPAVVVGFVAGSVLTFAYGARFLWGAFATKPVPAGVAAASDPGQGPGPAPRLAHGPVGEAHAPEEATDEGHGAERPGWPLVGPPVLLAALGLALGLAPLAATGLVRPAAAALDAGVGTVRLYLWHGFTPALGLSLVTVVAGTLFFLARGRVEALQGRLPPLPSAGQAYERSLAGLTRVADRTTGLVQNGSLPIYIGVILLTVLVLPGVALAAVAGVPDDLLLAESPLQVAAVAFVVGAAAGTAMARRRFAAVLFLGAVGFGVAVLFVIQGAPDLALTQLLVETLALVIFVLVLRHLPSQFETAAWPLGQGVRFALAAGVGLFMTTFALVAAGARSAPPVSDAYLDLALPEAGGRNVVNVILTDFRGLDTLGEITVLVVAALGIGSLVLAGRGERGRA
jgi:multicomponent Na+:H+ antiporter subunit A